MPTDVIGAAFIDVRARVTGFEQQVATKTRAAMAGAGREVKAGSAVVGAETAKMEATTVGRMERMGRSVESGLSRSFGAAKAQITSFLPSMGLLVPAAAGVAGAAMIKAAGNFQQAMEQVHTQAGAAQSEVESMKRSVLGMAGRVSQTPVALANGLYHIESAGFRGAKALSMLDAAAKGATVGNADLESVTQAMIASMASGIKGVTGASDAMAMLNRTVGIGDMRMEGLAQAMSTGILPSARSAGLGLNDVSAALATITDNATPPQEAATRLRMTFSMMAAPTPAATKALKTIGMTSTEMASDMRKPNGLMIAIDDLKKHLEDSGKTAVEQNAVIARAFGGGRTSGALLTLLEETDRLHEKYIQLGDSASRAKLAQDAWRHTQSNFNVEMHSLEANVSAAGIAIGTIMLPYVSKFVGWLSKGAGIVGRDFVPALQAVSSAIRSAFGDQHAAPKITVTPRPVIREAALNREIRRMGLHGAAMTAEVRASLIPKFTVPPSVVAARQAHKALQHVDLGHIDMAAATKNLNAGHMMAAAKAPATGLAQEFIKALTDAFHGKGTQSLGVAIGDVLKRALQGAFDLGAMLGKFIANTDWLSIGKKAGKTIIPMLVGILTTILDPGMLWNLISKHPFDILMAVLTVGAAPEKMIGKIGEILTKIPLVGKLLKWGLDAVHSLGRNMLSWAGDVVGSLWRGLERGLTGGKNPITDWVVREARVLPTRLGVMLLDAAEFGGRFLERIGSFIGKLPGKMGEWLGQAISKFVGWIGDMLDHIGIGKSQMSRVWTGIKDVFMGPVNWIRDNLLAPVRRMFSGFMDLIHGNLSGFGKIWGGIKDVFMAPVKWVIDHVFNGGIARAWNAVAGHLSLPKIPTIKLARGGPVPDIGLGRGGDTVPAMLMPGEYVLSKRAVDNLGMHTVEQLHQNARGMADGGIVGAITGAGKSAWNHTGGAAFNFAESIARKGASWAFDHVLNPIKSSVDSWGAGGGEIQHGIAHMADDLIDRLESFVKGKDASSGNFGGVSGNAASWSRTVLRALQLTSEPPSWLNGILTIIGHESGGNPRAINLTDSNAKAGDPSRGLMQTIGSTFEAYRLRSLPDDIYNPLANIVAGIRYIASRYGSIGNVPGLASMSRGGGYQGYASGGILPPGPIVGTHLPTGTTIALNEAGQEAVIPAPLLTQLIKWINNSHLAGGVISGRTIAETVAGAGATSAGQIPIATEVNRRAQAAVAPLRRAMDHAAHANTVAQRHVHTIQQHNTALRHNESILRSREHVTKAVRHADERHQATLDRSLHTENRAIRTHHARATHLEHQLKSIHGHTRAANRRRAALTSDLHHEQNVVKMERSRRSHTEDVLKTTNLQVRLDNMSAAARKRYIATHLAGDQKQIDMNGVLLKSAEKVANGTKKHLDTTTTAYKAAVDAAKAAADSLHQAVTQYVSDIADTFKQSVMGGMDLPSLFNYQAGYGTVSVSSVVAQLQDRVTAARNFGAVLIQLAAKGLDRDLLMQLAGAGPQVGMAIAQQLLNDPSAMVSINALEAQLSSISAATSASIAGASFGVSVPTQTPTGYAAGGLLPPGLIVGRHVKTGRIISFNERGQERVIPASQAMGTGGPASAHYTEVGPAIVVQGDFVVRNDRDIDTLSRELYRHQAAVARATGTTR